MASIIAEVALESAVCSGVRGMQRLRRSRSTSHTSMGRARGKTVAAKEYFEKHAVAMDLLKWSIAKGEGLCIDDVNKMAMREELSKAKLDEKVVSIATTEDETHTPVKNDEAAVTRAECRHYYGQEIHSYEEFFNLIGNDNEKFDDECIEEAASGNKCNSRTFFCREIESYDEFYNLVGGDHECLDDEFKRIESDVKSQPSRYFYGSEIHSYEDFFCLAGSDGQFDDECA